MTTPKATRSRAAMDRRRRLRPTILAAAERQVAAYEKAVDDAADEFDKAMEALRDRLGGRHGPYHVVRDISFKAHTITCSCGWDLTLDDLMAFALAAHRRESGAISIEVSYPTPAQQSSPWRRHSAEPTSAEVPEP